MVCKKHNIDIDGTKQDMHIIGIRSEKRMTKER
jgi:hypothetical protein